MKNLLVIAAIILVAALLFRNQAAAPDLVSAAPAHLSRIDSFEYATMLEEGKLTTDLLVPGQYTVIEGYLDSCGICKRLEMQFPAFLRERPDVVIRKVHFPESGMQFSFRSMQEAEDLVSRMNRYRFNDAKIENNSMSLSACGTPHVEIYGPDGNLIAGDDCKAGNDKSGLTYLNQWLAAELP